MKKIYWILIIILVLLVGTFFTKFIFANIEAKKSYINRYNNCLEFHKNENVQESELSETNECTNKGGCINPCGGCRDRPYVTIKEFIISPITGCSDVCKGGCLMPIESFE
tara:strand:+ start:7409 stop:7738 length:330 start_codon:yes stop_codon:yes gene_type:complete